MSSGMWFVVSVPKKEYDEVYDDEEVESTHSSKLSLNKEEIDEPVTSDKPVTLDTPVISVEPATSDEPVSLDEPDRALFNLNDGQQKEPSVEKPPLEKKDSVYSNIYFVEKKGPLEVMLRDVLPLLGIQDAVWTGHKDDLFYQVYFPCETPEKCDHILRALSVRGIGIIGKSTVAVLPCAVFYRETLYSNRESEEEDDDENLDDNEKSESVKIRTGKSKSSKGFKAMQKQFLKSITARLTVAQVVESVKIGSQLTFDFVMFVILASFIAAFGLMENSSVVIVASMLISPLMGPILAGTFGAAVRDKSLLILGIKAELLGLIICLVIGFLVGIACCEEYGGSPFPTFEMFGRGQLRSLWVGVLIAVPSGAGVALSVLGGNAGSLVGVAISASLLPPAVNAGLLWGISFLKHVKSYFFENEWITNENGEDLNINPALKFPEGYKPSFSTNMDAECAILGTLSLLLTIINIICIIISALVVLKIKEVAPRTNVKRTSRFWTHDIKVARQYNQTVRSQEADELGQTFLTEWAKCNEMNPEDILRDSKTSRITVQDMLRDAKDDDVYRTIVAMVPRSEDLTRRMTLGVVNRKYSLPTLTRTDVENGYGRNHGSSLKRIFSRKRRATIDEGVKDKQAQNDDPDLELVDLRRHSERAGSLRVSETLRDTLRKSFSVTPGSLWPPQSNLRRMSNTRFNVSTLDDPLSSFIPALPPRLSSIKTFNQKEG